MIWKTGSTFDIIAEKFVCYVKSVVAFYKANEVLVVFDGYASSTKDHEHIRWGYSGMPEVEITRQNRLTLTKDKFLTNFKNKDGLIKLLIQVFAEHGIRCEQATTDADTLIVKRAIDLSSKGAVNVIANDTDVLVLLLHHRTQFEDFIYLTTDDKTHDICGISAAMSETEKKYLLLGHAMSGCDTVSSLFGFGMMRLYDFVTSDSRIPSEFLDVFNHPGSSIDIISKAGVKVFEILFSKQKQNKKPSVTGARGRGLSIGRSTSRRGRGSGASSSISVPPPVQSLSNLRYTGYNQICAKGVVRPEILPPTEGAVKQHSLRDYLQVRDWAELECGFLDPATYGWRIDNGVFIPIGTLEPTAPGALKT